MSRALKFRCWDTVLKEWTQLTAASTHGQDDMYSPTVLVAFGAKSEEVAIQQYTGLEDKNGTEIYEGDILAVEWLQAHESIRPYVRNGKVIYSQSKAAYVLQATDEKRNLVTALGSMNLDIEDNAYVRSEVLGNCYENPELLHD